MHRKSDYELMEIVLKHECKSTTTKLLKAEVVWGTMGVICGVYFVHQRFSIK